MDVAGRQSYSLTAADGDPEDASRGGSHLCRGMIQDQKLGPRTRQAVEKTQVLLVL